MVLAERGRPAGPEGYSEVDERTGQRISLAMIPMRALGVTLFIASLTLFAQASKMKLEEFLRLTPSTTATGGAAAGHLFQADRGSRKGQHLHVATGAAADAGAPGPATSEYQLVGAKTAGALPDVDVLGIHYLKVRPDRRDAFETFVTRTLNPAVATLRPNLRLLYHKAVRGPDTGSYITISRYASRATSTGRAVRTLTSCARRSRR